MGLFGPPNIDKMKTKKDVRGLIKALYYHKNDDVRYDAAKALGEIGDTRAVEPLIAKLRYENVSRPFTEALVQIGAPAVEKLVAIRVVTEDKFLQKAADIILVRIGASAVEPLISTLRHGEGYQCFYAAIVLGRIGDARAVDSLVTACRSNREITVLAAIASLIQIKPPAVEALVVALGSQHNDVREMAIVTLGKIGAPAIKPLIAALGDVEAGARIGAASALAQIGAPAIKPLIIALRDKEWGVRKSAAQLLGQIGKPAVRPLIAALRDKNSSVRYYAVQALGQTGDSRAVEPLIAALGDEDSDVHSEAAQALGEIGDSRAVEPLIATLGDDNSSVRKNAAQSLDKLGWQPDEGSNGTAYWISKGDWGRCVQIGAPSVEPLITALKDKEYSVRKEAVQALGLIGDTRAVEPLITAHKDKEYSVRKEAVQALGLIGDTRAVEPLIAALKDKEMYIRLAAANALVAIYASCNITERETARILELRSIIVATHIDQKYHDDYGGSGNCHVDKGMLHQDQGVVFPV